MGILADVLEVCDFKERIDSRINPANVEFKVEKDDKECQLNREVIHPRA